MIGIVKTGDPRAVINLRVKPNPSAAVVAELANGEKVDFTAEQGDWLYGSWNGVSGWVDGKFISFDGQPAVSGILDSIVNFFTGGSSSSATSTSVSTTPYGNAGSTYYVNTQSSDLMMHKTADVDTATRNASIPKGAAVTLLDTTVVSATDKNGKTYGMVKVSYNGVTGYVAKEYLSTSPVATTGGDSTNPNNNEKMITMSDKTQKVLKIGGLILAGGAIAYGVYRMVKSDDKKGSKKKSKGLSGVSQFERLELK